MIGFAACYKSTVGELLAKMLNYTFVDTDAEIENICNASVQQIFDTQGEAYFRQKESDLLLTLNARDTVVACGGGSVMADSFAEFARDGIVVWLTASAKTVLSRLGGTPRPLFDRLTVGQLDSFMQHRIPLYAKHAHVEFSTDGKTPETIAEQIYNWIVNL